jgi:rhodanese-related sulfurtransferase
MTAQVVEQLPVQRRRTVDELVEEARAVLSRLEPTEAAEAVANGALLVDIRPHAQRVAEGEVPGALLLERNVLEWRLDPSSSARLPLASYDLQVVVLCSEGWTSSLAAASLQSLGVHRASDVVGGFLAWRTAGLATTDGGTPTGHRAGVRPPVLVVNRHTGDLLVHGEPVDVSRQQFALLLVLQEAQGGLVSREAATAAIGSSPGRAIDVAICRIRRRLGEDAARRIVTVRGRGFRLLP